MSNWISCEYYRISADPSQPNEGLPSNEIPVNLDDCYSFEKCYSEKNGFHQLKFMLLKDEPITWEFLNIEHRDLEFDRALELTKKSTR